MFRIEYRIAEQQWKDNKLVPTGIEYIGYKTKEDAINYALYSFELKIFVITEYYCV